MDTHRAPLPLAVLVAALLLLSGCGDPTADAVAEADPSELPDWVERLSPLPGQEVESNVGVQVEHLVSAPDEGLRLRIDGVDVTSYSEEGRGLLVYDPGRSQAPQPVELDPGEHTAELERVAVDPQTDEVEETIETFTWTFSFL